MDVPERRVFLSTPFVPQFVLRAGSLGMTLDTGWRLYVIVYRPIGTFHRLSGGRRRLRSTPAHDCTGRNTGCGFLS